MSARYVLVMEDIIEPFWSGASRVNVLLVDTEKVIPILDSTVAKSNQDDIERMVLSMYIYVKIVKPRE